MDESVLYPFVLIVLAIYYALWAFLVGKAKGRD